MAGSAEFPSQTYYVAAKLRIILRFEEFSNGAAVRLQTPTTIQTKLKGTKPGKGALRVIPDPEAPPGVKRLVLASSGDSTGAGPQAQLSSSDALTWSIGGVIPKTATWKANSVRTADELDATVRFLDLPFDPRAIRAAAVEFYLGSHTEEDFANAVSGAPPAGDAGSGQSLLLLPDGFVDDLGRERTNRRFQGWVDEWRVRWPKNEEPIVELSCRDNTRPLIDQEAPPKLAVDATVPIDQAIAAYLSNFPQFSGVSVEYRPGGFDPPVLKDSLAKSAFRPHLGPVPSKDGGASEKLSVWDYLTDVCGSIGHLVRVSGTTVVVQRARTLYGQEWSRDDDPYRERVLASGLRLPRRHIVYGRNVDEMAIARQYSKRQAINVEVRSYSTLRKNVVVARFPIGKDRRVVSSANPGDGGSEQVWRVFRVAGVDDPKVLRLVAQSVYEQVGRNELGVQIKTRDFSSFGGGASDPDLLDLQVGDSVELLVNRDDDFSSTTQLEATMLVAERAREFVVAAGYSDGLAAAYARAYSDGGFQTAFRVRAFEADWSIDGGVSLRIDAVNYLEVRLDNVLPAGEDLDPAKQLAPANAAQPKGH